MLQPGHKLREVEQGFGAAILQVPLKTHPRVGLAGPGCPKKSAEWDGIRKIIERLAVKNGGRSPFQHKEFGNLPHKNRDVFQSGRISASNMLCLSWLRVPLGASKSQALVDQFGGHSTTEYISCMPRKE